jgi:hypothetical protein
MKNKVVTAYLLADPKRSLNTVLENGQLVIHLPKEAPDSIASVIVLQIDGPVVLK